MKTFKYNKDLAFKRNCDIYLLEELYNKLNLLFKKAEECKPTQKSKLRSINRKLTKLEFKLQKAWGYKENALKHRYWFELPHCTCPVIDNKERLGTMFYIINENCPIHSTDAIDEKINNFVKVLTDDEDCLYNELNI